MADEFEKINQRIGELTTAINEHKVEMSNRLGRLEQQVSNEGALCPFREAISRSSNNVMRAELAHAHIDSVEDKMHALELQFARAGIVSGAAGGGIFSAVGLVVFAIGKAASWW